MLSLSQKAAWEKLCNVIQHDKLSSTVAALKPGACGLCKTPKPLAEIPRPEAEDFTTKLNLFLALESRGHSPRVSYFHSRQKCVPTFSFLFWR